MPVFRLLKKDIAFPQQHYAEPNGLLAIGGDLQPNRLVWAYQNGIFPWFEEDGTFFWYCPDPRCVLFPTELKVHKSMRSIFNQNKFRYTIDTCFREVMAQCANKVRHDDFGASWISDKFIDGYSKLHELGLAHSVEVWSGNDLVGGFYGISLGKVFFGESMFAHTTNASKAGFIQFARGLQEWGFRLIDCQQETDHLVSLGARTISRELFLEYLEQNRYERTFQGRWSFGEDGNIVMPEESPR
jgi:leucyl/phenylalanyl-tRNA---protein transferase